MGSRRFGGALRASPQRWIAWFAVWTLGPLATVQAQRVYTPYTFTTLAGQADRGSADGVGIKARFWHPWGVVADARGHLWITDLANCTIRRVSPAGVVVTVAGTAGNLGAQDGLGSAASFRGPSGVALDGEGNLIIADSGNHVIRKRAPDGMVSTLAGFSPGHADGVGRLARFQSPAGLAVDETGIVYVADAGNHAIRKVGRDGTVTTLAGKPTSKGSRDGMGAQAQFNAPVDVALGPGDSLYVCDRDNSTIRVVTTEGQVSTLAGEAGNTGSTDGQGAAARFSQPTGIAIDRHGVAYVADTGNSVIRRVLPDGTVDTVAGGGPGFTDGVGREAGLGRPTGIDVDGSGDLYVTDPAYNLLRKITPGGVVTTLAGSVGGPGWSDGVGEAARFEQPYGIAADANGNVYVVDRGPGTVRKVAPDCRTSTLAGFPWSHGHVDGMGAVARFDFPNGVAVDGEGNLYVTDAGLDAPAGTAAGTVRKIKPDGTVSTLAGKRGEPGSSDGLGEAARFRMPVGVAVDGSGHVYVADSDNHTVRRITPAGIVSTMAGLAGSPGYADGVGNAARFRSPLGIAVDHAGNLYVADSLNNVVRKITPLAAVTTLAGLNSIGGAVDGTGNVVRFDAPWAVAVDQETNVYVVDLHANGPTIRRISPSGVVTTLAGGGWGPADGWGAEVGFDWPQGIAVDAHGFVYVADTAHYTIRKGWPGFWPTLAVPSVRADGLVELEVAGSPGYAYTVAASEGFRDWRVLTNFISTSRSTAVIHRPGSNPPPQFYRASSP